jgi:hypothetical protein
MSIFDVLLDTEDIVILGPPTNIDVRVDVGPKGDRGARFFVGSGNPNIPGVIPLGQNPLVGDVFVNASTASEYGWLYLYVRTPSGNAWVPTLRLQPSIFSANISTIFTSGESQISIPLANIVPDTTILDVEKYIIQCTSNKNVPVALSVSSKIIQGPSLIFTVKAAGYSGGSWTNLDGPESLDITVTVI